MLVANFVCLPLMLGRQCTGGLAELFAKNIILHLELTLMRVVKVNQNSDVKPQ